MLAVAMLLMAPACKKKSPPPEPPAALTPEVVAEQPQLIAETPEQPDAGPDEEAMVVIATADGGGIEYTTFFITTDPPDASVLINHLDVGRSPLSARLPTRSVWGVSAELPGYQRVEQTVWPKPGQPTTIALRLEPLPVDAGPPAPSVMTVVVESFPTGAVVLIDREDAGATPLTAQISAQPHEVIVLYAGYLRAIEYIDGGAGETKRVFAKLVPGF